MPLNRLRDGLGRGDHGELNGSQGPRMINGGEVDPAAPWGTPGNGVREVRNYQVRARDSDGAKKRPRDLLSGVLLWGAGLIIAASLAGAAYVAYESQRLFALAHNHGDAHRAIVTAGLPDAGWVAMALVALVAALKGRSSARARLGVVIFFGLSLGAQLMYAEHTIEGYLVAIIAPVVLAWMLESFVVEVRRWAAGRRGLDMEESPILSSIVRGAGRGLRGGVRLLMWVVRLGFDRSGTWAGVRDWVLDEAPLAPGRTAASLRAAAAIEQAGTAEQVAAVLVDQARGDAAEQVEQARAEAERLTTEKADLASEVQRLRERVEVLQGGTAKERLWGLYEQLGRDRDPRFGDRARVGEVARELYGPAGLRSEGTARTYLYEYIEVKGTKGTRETSDQRVMIGGQA
jgi:hypothetical protein